MISSHTTADKDISGNHGVFSCSFMLKYCNIFTQYSPILTKWVMLPSKHRFWLVSREFIRHMEREEQQKAMKNNLSPSKLLKKRKWMENWRSGPPPDWNCKGCSLDASLGLLSCLICLSSLLPFVGLRTPLALPSRWSDLLDYAINRYVFVLQIRLRWLSQLRPQ